MTRCALSELGVSASEEGLDSIEALEEGQLIPVKILLCVWSYGTTGRIAGALGMPRRVTVNDRLPVGSPSGSLTIM